MIFRLTVALLCVATSSQVFAEAPCATACPEPAQPSPFGAAASLAANDLAQIAGQADLNQSVLAENNSTVSGNSVSGHSQTGTIAFDGQSFEGLNGLSVLSANTGNNVAINSSLNVNVAVHP